MTDKEKIDKWVEEHDGEDYCRFCIYGEECSGIVCYGGPPIEPPCCTDDILDLLDTESILEEIDNGEE